MAAELLVTHPPDHVPERGWILDVLLRDWLGLSVEIVPGEPGWTVVTAPGSNGRLAVVDRFLPEATAAWLQPASLPEPPLPAWDVAGMLPDPTLVAPGLPVLFGRPEADGRFLVIEGDCIRLGLDVPGSAFFLLSRYEELIGARHDQHGRFSADASLAARAGFLHRPLANEYLEVLWACMKRLWPGLARRRRSYAVDLSHDVDRPFDIDGRSWPRVVRSVGADLLLRKDPLLAARRLVSRLRRGEARWRSDPNNTFASILATSERHGLKSTFYFKAGCTHPRYDDPYSLDAPPIQALLREIHERGHEIGLHPSYDTWRDRSRVAAELAVLRRATERIGIQQSTWGGRQHYLRFRAPETWRHYEAAGLAYDATLTFADWAGFRCGTCYDYPVFDLENRQPLRLRERPLIVMEGTMLGKRYMRLSPKQARQTIVALAQACRRFGGTFSLLWHNSELVSAGQRQLYRDVVVDVAGSTT